MTLDDFDLSILRCLQESTRTATEEIADRVGLSASACQRRMKRLREGGWIEAEVAILSQTAFSGRTTLVVDIALVRGGADMVDAFKRELADVPEVQQIYYTTGDTDFVLIVTAPSIAAYEQLTRRLFFDNPKVRKFHTTVVMETVKAGLGIPL